MFTKKLTVMLNYYGLTLRLINVKIKIEKWKKRL